MQTKHGVEAKNYENLGDAAKLKPLEVELKRLEDLSESIVQDFAHMRQREVGFPNSGLRDSLKHFISGGNEGYQ